MRCIPPIVIRDHPVSNIYHAWMGGWVCKRLASLTSLAILAKLVLNLVWLV